MNVTPITGQESTRELPVFRGFLRGFSRVGFVCRFSCVGSNAVTLGSLWWAFEVLRVTRFSLRASRQFFANFAVKSFFFRIPLSAVVEIKSQLKLGSFGHPPRAPLRLKNNFDIHLFHFR